MNSASIDMDDIQALAAEHGLVLRGGFEIREGDAVPECQPGQAAGVLLLFGQVGSGIWERFSQSAEYADGNPDPLDRWSARMGEMMARHLGGRALFPFEGPPWHPFGQWAQRAESLRPSPLGILMHPDHGLWHAYRFAIALPATPNTSGQKLFPQASLSPARHACDNCVDTPCLQACPVKAFSNDGYDVAACAAYLHEHEQAPCHQLGCLARLACPEAPSLRYEPEHARFHMKQFCYSLPRFFNE